MIRFFSSLLVVLWCCLALRAQGQVIISFDYTYDTAGFFTDADRRAVLERAALDLTSHLTDTLDGIASPNANNTWSQSFFRPDTGAVESVANPVVAANTLVIYAGGRSLAGSTLGVGGSGSFGVSFTMQSWLDNVVTRGEPGMFDLPNTDYAPWGGSITFDTDVGTVWYFDQDVTTTADIPGGSADFYSVAVHELGHVLGFLSGDPDTSWQSQISGGSFGGAAATQLFGGAVPLSGDESHWVDGTTSTRIKSTTSQEVAMDPSIALGTRKFFTRLDFAGLSDIGWQVVAVPEPEEVAAAGGAALMLFALLRRWHRSRRFPVGV